MLFPGLSRIPAYRASIPPSPFFPPRTSLCSVYLCPPLFFFPITIPMSFWADHFALIPLRNDEGQCHTAKSGALPLSCMPSNFLPDPFPFFLSRTVETPLRSSPGGFFFSDEDAQNVPKMALHFFPPPPETFPVI